MCMTVQENKMLSTRHAPASSAALLLLVAVVAVLIGSCPVSSFTEELLPLYMNVGGDKIMSVDGSGTLVDEANGISWLPEKYVTGGVESFVDTWNATVHTNVTNLALFAWQRQGQAFHYDIPLQQGTYQVLFHFVELDETVGVGDRVMHVKMQNELVLKKFDILQETGGQHHNAIVKKFQVDVDEDNVLTISFARNTNKVKAFPILSAMEVHPLFDVQPVPRVPALYSRLYETKVLAVAAMMRYDGKVVFWSSSIPFGHPPPKIHQTYISVFDPDTGTSNQEIVHTEHDMFCPGISTLEDGRVLITGGRAFNNTSFYDPIQDYWIKGPRMHVNRGYQSQATLGDGTVFVMGGSWPDGTDPKYGEVWTDEENAWTLKSGLRPQGSLLTRDKAEDARDNFMWFIQAPDGRLLHAGPSQNMHWIDVKGNGTITPIGPRGDDDDSMCGNAIVYDIGKVLKLGGSPRFNHRSQANNRAYVIDLNGAAGSDPVVTRVGDMHYQRGNVNSVVLPNGEVLVLGGQTRSKGLSDLYSSLVCEIWNPGTQQFTLLEGMMSVPRNYHSTALLLRDGRVISAGQNSHFSAQIITPPYLLDAAGNELPRPTIESYSTTSLPYRGQTTIPMGGGQITVRMDTSEPHTFALVRLGAVTHSTNIDQRRIPLAVASQNDVEFVLDVPDNTNVVLPGSYYLFAMNVQGAPSVAVYLLREPNDPAMRNKVYPTPPPKDTSRVSMDEDQNPESFETTSNQQLLAMAGMVPVAIALSLLIAKRFQRRESPVILPFQ